MKRLLFFLVLLPAFAFGQTNYPPFITPAIIAAEKAYMKALLCVDSLMDLKVDNATLANYSTTAQTSVLFAPTNHNHAGLYEPILGFTPYNATNPAGYLSAVPAQSFASLTGKPTTLLGYGIIDAFDGTWNSLTGKPTTTSFLSNSANKNFVTDAQLTVIGNTAGTNSGNDAPNTLYANDYRAANFVAGTNYLAPNGNGSSLTGLTKGQVGLSNAENTSDASKPVSSATQIALNLKANLTSAALVTPDIGVATGTSVTATGAIRSSGTAGIGYTTGAGGTVTQVTSKSTGVTLNKISGQITMNGAALAAAAEVAFTLTNSTIASTDVVIVNIQSVGTAGSYFVAVGAVGNGSCSITVGNASTASLSQALVLNFAVIKSVNN